MKTRWIGSLVLAFVLLAGLLQADAKAGAHTCPIIPIEVYGGASLYEAQHYENDDCNPPTLSYIYGAFTYPQTCPVCLPYSPSFANSSNPIRSVSVVKPFQSFHGLAAPVPANYEHTMPAGRPRKYTKKAATPDGIRYLHLEKQDVYVKVFAFDVNRNDMASGDEPDNANFKNTLYFAFECADPATIGVDPAQIKIIHEAKQKPLPDPGGAATTVYDVTYDFAENAGQAHILTFLCGDPEPPADQPTPVASNQ